MGNNKQFVESNYKLIQYVVAKLAKNWSKEEQEDLVHDTVIRLLSAKEQDVEQPSAFVNLVVSRIMQNTVRDNSTDALNHCVSLDQPIITKDGEKFTNHDVVSNGSVIDGFEEVNDRTNSFLLYASDIEDLCRFLTRQRAKLFKLRYLHGYTAKEIAEMEDMEVNTVRMTLKRAVKDAHKLKEIIPEVKGKWDGQTLREMALNHLPDEILHPFQLRYLKSKNLMEIVDITGQPLAQVNRALRIGERMINERYGLDVRNT